MDTTGLGQSDIGRRRSNNEDAYAVDNDRGLYLVADGMGGHAGGEVASRLAVQAIRAHVERYLGDLPEAGHEGRGAALERLMGDAVLAACRAVHNRALDDDELAGMGATATAVLCDHERVALAHVGDSRAYLIRNGNAHRLTTDHTMTQELVTAGVISPEEVAKHPYRNVLTRNLGSQAAVKVDTLLFDPEPGDRILLCTDGLSEYTPDLAWLATQLSALEPEEAVESLIRHANVSGGRDNITAVIVAVEADAGRGRELSEASLNMATIATMQLFGRLPLRHRVLLANAFVSRDFETGDVIVSPPAALSGLHVISSGAVEVQAEGLPPRRVDPGEYFGRDTLLRPRAARAAVRALEPGGVLVLTREAFQELVRARPWLGIRLLERLGQSLANTHRAAP